MNIQKGKYTILICSSCYLPGYKGGGPIRTIANLVEQMGDEFHFKIFTMDHDLNEPDKPYQTIRSCEWNRIGKADVFYMSAEKQSWGEFRSFFNSTEYDIIYLNSFFSYDITIRLLLLRRFWLIPDKPFILAPRGEFSTGALNLKKMKKQIYLRSTKLFGLYRRILWQASSVYEETDIRRQFGRNIPVIIAPNLPTVQHLAGATSNKVYKAEKSLKILFLSRISRKKNLKGALEALNGLKGDIQFDIYGPIEDKGYWDECQIFFHHLPNNIKVQYCGSIQHDEVMSVMANYDLFFLPTLGENFGHVILEALCAGCPVIISDQTPWRDLEMKRVGWDLPLAQPDRFHAALQACVDMDNEYYTKWSRKCSEYGRQITRNADTVLQNRRLFQHAISMSKHGR